MADGQVTVRIPAGVREGHPATPSGLTARRGAAVLARAVLVVAFAVAGVARA